MPSLCFVFPLLCMLFCSAATTSGVATVLLSPKEKATPKKGVTSPTQQRSKRVAVQRGNSRVVLSDSSDGEDSDKKLRGMVQRAAQMRLPGESDEEL